MPINTSVRTKDPYTGTAKMADANQFIAVFGFIGLHELKSAFETSGDQPKKPGRKADFPPLALVACLTGARITGSVASAVNLLHKDEHLWEQCADAYEQRSGVRLPPAPPTYDQVRGMRDRIAADPDLLARIQQRFREIAVGQARLQGNLRPGVEPNGAQPLEAHAVYGDGTIIAEYSDVRVVQDPVTKKGVVIGSRATNPEQARVQRTVSDTKQDDKDSRGLNMVALHTWTTSGRVTLGTAVALGAEAWAAMDLIESLHKIAGDGIHSLIYDRAITGWHVDALMANCRIQVIGKAVGVGSRKAVS